MTLAVASWALGALPVSADLGPPLPQIPLFIAFDETGGRCVVLRGESLSPPRPTRLECYSWPSKRLERVVDLANMTGCAAFSISGALATCPNIGARTVTLVDLSGSKPTASFSIMNTGIIGVDWSRSDIDMASTGADVVVGVPGTRKPNAPARIFVVDGTAKRLRWSASLAEVEISAPSLDPKSDRVAVCVRADPVKQTTESKGNAGGRVCLVSRDGTVRELAPPTPALARRLVFSPDGKWLAGAFDDGILRVWSTGNPAVCVREIRGKTRCWWRLAFSGDSSALMACDDRGTGVLLTLKDNKTRDFPRMGPALSLALSADAGTVVLGNAANFETEVWTTTNGGKRLGRLGTGVR